MTASQSSLGYEILLYLHTYYSAIFGLSEFLIIFFKIIELPYTTGILTTEILIVLFLCCTEAVRIFMGHKGNLTEKNFFIITSIALTLPAVLGVIYLLIWQTYVLRVEIILCSIQLTLLGIELGLAISCLLRFCRAKPYYNNI